jgi:flavin reductase (DIM6/NTAB) family NADH-FMN oxidoreductase RutF
MMAISVGLTRYSHDLIKNSGEFVVCFPSEQQQAAMIFCGTHSGRDYDKFAETSLEPLPASKVGVPLIGDAVANFECKLVSSLLTGDHTIFVGQVVASHVGRPGLRRVYTLGPNEFGGLG